MVEAEELLEDIPEAAGNDWHNWRVLLYDRTEILPSPKSRLCQGGSEVQNRTALVLGELSINNFVAQIVVGDLDLSTALQRIVDGLIERHKSFTVRLATGFGQVQLGNSAPRIDILADHLLQ